MPRWNPRELLLPIGKLLEGYPSLTLTIVAWEYESRFNEYEIRFFATYEDVQAKTKLGIYSSRYHGPPAFSTSMFERNFDRSIERAARKLARDFKELLEMP